MRPSSVRKQSALLLIGHGSTVNRDSSTTAIQHAKAISKLRLFGEVQTAFLKELPYIKDALSLLSSGRVYVVPFAICEGWFTQQIIPRELGLSDGKNLDFPKRQIIQGKEIHYCSPVGTHESMMRILQQRVTSILNEFPTTPSNPLPKDIALCIAGHGTGQNNNSRTEIEKQANLLRNTGIYGEVHAIFMEEDPKIESVYDLTRLDHLVVVPFFVAEGLHSQEDIPVMLGADAKEVQQRLANKLPGFVNPRKIRNKTVWYTPPVGTEPLMVEVILAQVEQMMNSPVSGE